MTGDTFDPELADDLVGVASARLTAAGVPRGERIRALRLLSILATLADTDLRVRRPLTMVASEFDLPVDEVDIWLDDLVAIGVVRLEGTAMVLGGREPSRQVRMSLHDFLDAAAELDAAPEPRRRVPALLLRPSSAVLAAAAVVALAVLGPAVLDGPSTTVASRGGTESPVVPTTANPKPPAGEVDTDDEAPPTGAVDGGEQLGPVVVDTSSTTLLPCPSGAPLLEVTGATVDALGRLAVDGVARNDSDEPLTIDTFTLRTTVDGQEITAPGIERALLVPARSSVLWQARLPVVAPAGTLVRATLGEWEWQGLEIRTACPSP